VNGIQNKKGMASSSDFLGFSGQDLDATIDLGKTEMLSSVRLHCFQQPASWIYLPEKVTASFSNDGTLFTDAVELMISDDDIFNVLLPKETTARYIRLIAKNAGMIKNGNPGSGNPAWLFADEIEVE